MFWFFLLAVLWGWGCTSVASVSTPARSARFEPIEHTLPPLLSDQATSITHDFEVKNDTPQRIVIQGLSKSCSCTTAKLSAKELAPGQVAKLTLTVDLRGRTGEFVTQCVVAHDAGNPWVCSLKVPIHQRIAFVPENLELDAVTPGREIRRAFSVVSHELEKIPPEPDLKVIRGFESVAIQKLETQVEQLGNKLNRRTTQFQARWTPLPEIGLGYSEISANVDPGAEVTDRSEYLRLAWRVDHDYQVTPSRVFFGKVDRQSGTRQVEIVLKKLDGRPFKIMAVDDDCPVVSIACATIGKQAAEHRVSFTLDTAGMEKVVFGTARVQVDSSVTPVLKLPIVATR